MSGSLRLWGQRQGYRGGHRVGGAEDVSLLIQPVSAYHFMELICTQDGIKSDDGQEQGSEGLTEHKGQRCN